MPALATGGETDSGGSNVWPGLHRAVKSHSLGRFDAMITETLPTYTPTLFDAAVRRAVELLRAGEVVALPTETVYGLAANALNPEAVAKIFAIKIGRAHV